MEVKRRLGLAREIMGVLILVAKFILLVMKIVSGATNYRAHPHATAYLFSSLPDFQRAANLRSYV